jgi:hypothetical protein
MRKYKYTNIIVLEVCWIVSSCSKHGLWSDSFYKEYSIVIPYLQGFFLCILGVVLGECIGILDIQGFISEVKGYILSYIFEVLLKVVSKFFFGHEMGEFFFFL